MEKMDLRTLLRNNPYPGRGILVGKSQDECWGIIAYFIMGRSQNSRNRVFVETEDGIRTQAHDPSKMTDPSLIIYHPVRRFGNQIIVTNGDQTDTIWEALTQGGSFEDALRTRTFEPDEPNWTPRISSLMTLGAKDFQVKLSILKSGDGNGNYTQRQFFDYPSLPGGEGRFLHTYKGDGNPIPSFEGEPERVEMFGNLESFSQQVWESLDPDNKVSLFTCFVNLSTGETQTRIINKHQG